MLSKNALATLAAITLLIIGAAWYITKSRSPETEIRQAPFFPDLINRVNDIARIEIRTRNQNTVLSNQGEGWVIENRSRYPALFEKVKGAVMAVAGLEILEGKTKNKELYPRLGVEDIETEGSSSRQILFFAQEAQPLVSLIVGKERTQASGRYIPALYVRKAGEAQAFLVKGELAIPANPMDWADRELLDLAAERICEITIEPPGQSPLRIHRKDRDTSDYTLDTIPQGSRLKSQTVLNSLASALESLQFDEVVARSEFTPPPNPTTTTLRAFDGLIARVTLANINDKPHASFEFLYDAQAEADKQLGAEPKSVGSNPPAKAEAKPSVEEEVAKLNEKTRNWVYILPTYKAALLTKTLSDLTAPKEEPKTKKEPKAEDSIPSQEPGKKP